ncbi:MAG: CRTAC1 family protein [Phycisphaerales bacterium]|nr:MAG: CRTAC1 family protein [Phycisphaerales bacterium]
MTVIPPLFPSPRLVRRGAVLLLLLACGICLARSETTIELTDVTRKTGITFRHNDGSSGRYYIIENVSAGLALFDYDNDGDIDIYFLSGGALPGTDFEAPPRNALYRNEGHWKFTDVTDQSGLGDPGHALGVAVGDYDNDGHQDVYVTNFGPNVLFRSNGDGTFTDVTTRAGVADGHKVGAGANFLDIDADGDLDLFSSSYVDFTYDNHVFETVKGHPIYVGPRAYEPTPDTLYRNNGDGTFTDISAAAGIAAHPGTGMGTVCADYDNDGDTDIFVANDLRPNFLWQNDGTGRFEEMGLLAGLACNMNGDDMGSMGIGCGDYNNDGLLDFYVTAYQQQFPSLYRNFGDGMFEDVTLITGAGAGTNHTVTWGNDFADFDNDGDRDLFLALGHLADNIEHWDKRSSYLATNKLFMNTGAGKFTDISDTAGDGMKVKLSSRAAGFDDLDDDGDVDVVVLNSRREPTVLENTGQSQGHWLQVKLRGTKSNRDGVGARVKVIAGDLTLIDEMHSGRGYQSHYGMRLYFGLGARCGVDHIEVRWIGGLVDTFSNIKADQCITLVEGTSKKND